MKSKNKRFEKIVQWNESNGGFSRGDFYLYAILFFFLYIICFSLFGWIYGLMKFFEHAKKIREESRSVYWREIK